MRRLAIACAVAGIIAGATIAAAPGADAGHSWTARPASPVRTSPSAACTSDRYEWLNTVTITPGSCIVSIAHPQAELDWQGDGNWVLYSFSSGVAHAVWATNTCCISGSSLKVQRDGNVVIYGPDGSVRWAENYSGPVIIPGETQRHYALFDYVFSQPACGSNYKAEGWRRTHYLIGNTWSGNQGTMYSTCMS